MDLLTKPKIHSESLHCYLSVRAIALVQPVQVASRTGNMEAIPDSLLVGDVY
ncbi:MAG: hypothetical protein WBL95_26660 [Microcoleus sp.]